MCNNRSSSENCTSATFHAEQCFRGSVDSPDRIFALPCYGVRRLHSGVALTDRTMSQTSLAHPIVFSLRQSETDRGSVITHKDSLHAAKDNSRSSAFQRLGTEGPPAWTRFIGFHLTLIEPPPAMARPGSTRRLSRFAPPKRTSRIFTSEVGNPAAFLHQVGNSPEGPSYRRFAMPAPACAPLCHQPHGPIPFDSLIQTRTTAQTNDVFAVASTAAGQPTLPAGRLTAMLTPLVPPPPQTMVPFQQLWLPLPPSTAGRLPGHFRPVSHRWDSGRHAR